MNDYKIAFYYSPDDGSYVTSVPELPGCMSDGKTIEEAISNTRTVIDEWIDVAKEDNRIIPQPLDDIEYTDANSVDVAGYILEKAGSMTAWALEKLTYYCKVWSLVWYGRAIVNDVPQAWKDGPVFPSLYSKHKGLYVVTPNSIKSTHELSDSEKKVVDNILEVYSFFGAEELRDMTHTEQPWIIARGDIPVDAVCHNDITNDMITAYYTSA